MCVCVCVYTQATHCSTLQQTAIRCNTLQYTALTRDSLQITPELLNKGAVNLEDFFGDAGQGKFGGGVCGELVLGGAGKKGQGVRGRTLIAIDGTWAQVFVAVCCSVRWSVLQHDAKCCSVLQCVGDVH